MDSVLVVHGGAGRSSWVVSFDAYRASVASWSPLCLLPAGGDGVRWPGATPADEGWHVRNHNSGALPSYLLTGPRPCRTAAPGPAKRGSIRPDGSSAGEAGQSAPYRPGPSSPGRGFNDRWAYRRVWFYQRILDRGIPDWWLPWWEGDEDDPVLSPRDRPERTRIRWHT